MRKEPSFKSTKKFDLSAQQLNETANLLYYDTHASGYEQSSRHISESNKKRVDQLLKKYLPLQRDSVKALDVCCGTGFYLSMLIKHMPASQVFGSDISQEMLQLASRYTPNLTKASIYDLPYKENSFDIVTASSALHHLENISEALSQIRRVLKPSGILITDYDNNYHYARFAHAKTKLLNIMKIYPLFQRKHNQQNRPNKSIAQKKNCQHALDLAQLTQEQLHEFAEPQNQKYNGIHVPKLLKLLRAAGFSKTQVYLYNSSSWKQVSEFNYWNNLFYNKVCTVSQLA